MNFRRSLRREEPEINFIPLIDVLLVILIFLMVTTTYANSITLTPGTVTVLVDDTHMLIHCIAQEAEDGLASGDMERHCKRLEG